MSFFQLYLGLNFTIEHNSPRRSIFPSACFCCDTRLSLNLEEPLVMGFSSSDFVFCHSKVFRLDAIVHDGAGAVRWNSGKLLFHEWTKTKFMFARSREWTTLSRYVKLFLSSIFISVDFWSSMFCIVREIDVFEDENDIKEWGVVIDGNVPGYIFSAPKRYKPTKTNYLLYKNFECNCVEQWKFVFPWTQETLPKVVKAEETSDGTKRKDFVQVKV